MSMKLSDMQVFRKTKEKSGVYDKYQERFVICITPKARLILSRTVVEALGEPTHVTFRTDGKNMIAISPAKEGDVSAYVLGKAGGNSTAETSKYRVLSCVALLKHMNYVMPASPMAYTVEAKSGAIWLDLSAYPARV